MILLGVVLLLFGAVFMFLFQLTGVAKHYKQFKMPTRTASKYINEVIQQIWREKLKVWNCNVMCVRFDFTMCVGICHTQHICESYGFFLWFVLVHLHYIYCIIIDDSHTPFFFKFVIVLFSRDEIDRVTEIILWRLCLA